ncbi:hypothetical protein DYB32_000595 [Aphanomyces invadans]|uniref:glutamate synthase (ferredoxin) n=1 Tax=Aphanomyces invadans TaxID=157072 RepID=A0A3R6ZX35_9STRA|nr:hypothetical protein DYB32_000595 [Aphanomyces invadans]
MLRASLLRHRGNVVLRAPHASPLSSYSYFRNAPKHPAASSSVVGQRLKPQALLYQRELEKDSCGVGILAQLQKKPSRKVVLQANEMLVRMSHRGGCGCDPASGDGAGMLVGMPHKFIQRLVDEGAFGGARVALVPEQYAVGNVFFTKNSACIEASKKSFNALAKDLNLTVVGWRMCCSQSNTQAHDFNSHLALVHSRFSTNTFPSWDRAQPYRVLCHNGEINTLRGNKNWMFARGSKAHSAYFGHATSSLLPVCNFDAALELLTTASSCDRSLPEAMMMMIPEAWQTHMSMPAAKKAMYQYNACMMEPWDGPAMVAFTNGKTVGASLDRNGLRPSRYYVTTDDHVMLSSEVGVIEGLMEADVAAKYRLEPGKMFFVDFDQGRIVSDDEIKATVSAARPYGEWVQHMIHFQTPAVAAAAATQPGTAPLPPADMPRRLNLYGFTTETMEMLLVPMGLEHKEALGSMGNDAPLAVLSEQPKMPNEYFKQLFAQAAQGQAVLVLSDQAAGPDRFPIPSLLVVGAVHQHLLRTQQRTSVAIFAECGDAKEVHDFATLLGFGADGVCPYMAYHALGYMNSEGLVEAIAKKKVETAALWANYQTAVGKGLLKVMSKMGISTLQSYKGAQVFEAVGLGADVIDRCFYGTTNMATLYDDIARLHEAGFPTHSLEMPLVRNPGQYHARENGELHFNTPSAIVALQTAARTQSRDAYGQYRDLTNAASKCVAAIGWMSWADCATGRRVTLRGLLAFQTVPEERRPRWDEMEPIANIVKRFNTGAMSLGSISRETHEALAIAMNQLGGRSNTGEGGEDPKRYMPQPDGAPNPMRSAIKQVASGRFGVTMHYLSNADQLQIKMAQGAKPGEGGELPGHKVSPYIAARRHTTPGPHHDIYSIEDLAQLIHDLKNSNPTAEMSVKLVSEVGVGIVAAGVVKAKAEHITISGHDGTIHDIPSRIKLQTDGQLKTGRDVVIAALLGAEEYGFATAPLIALGCVMMRKCHLNTCPVGIATQDEELRKKFTGMPEHIQQIVRSLGATSLDEVIGRADLLQVDESTLHRKTYESSRPWDGMTGRCRRLLDLSPLLVNAQTLSPGSRIRYDPNDQQDHELDTILDQKLLEQCALAIEDGTPVQVALPISNVDRTVGALLSHVITKKHGERGCLPPNTIRLHLHGHAGQSLGFGLVRGVELKVLGDANDYVGKALSGGTVIVAPEVERGHNQTIVGNAVLYGATSGKAFFRGKAGERFAVRNSGVHAVVEGVGDHGCEYMTGGRVVILGPTGRNFGAGMSGGIAYVYDPSNEFADKCNQSMGGLEALDEDEQFVKDLIQQHVQHTNSPVGETILADWDATKHAFVKLMPHDYKHVMATTQSTNVVVESTVEARRVEVHASH